MNTKIDRNYYVLKTSSGDAIGLLSLMVPSNETSMFEFSLHNPECKDKPNEFMDLMHTDMDFAEYQTHRDAFETYDELEIVQTWIPTGLSVPITVLVKKKENSNDDEG
jgi:hypothetical protein